MLIVQITELNYCMIISQATEMSTTTITPEPPVSDDTQPTTPVEKTPPPSEEPAVKVDNKQSDTEEKENKEKGKTPEAAVAASGEGESGKNEKTKMSEAEAALDKDLDGVSNAHTLCIHNYHSLFLIAGRCSFSDTSASSQIQG